MAKAILQDFTPSAIISAIEQAFIECTAAYVRPVQEQVHEEPELMWVFTGLPLSYYNGVMRTTLRMRELCGNGFTGWVWDLVWASRPLRVMASW